MNAREILAKVIEVSNASVDVDRRLANLVQTLASAFSVPLCGLFLWDARQGRLHLKFINEKHPWLKPGLSFLADEGPLGTCVLQKIPVIIDDSAQRSLWEPRIPRELASLGFWASFPIADDIFLYGVLALWDTHPRPLTEEERDLLPVICRQLAGTIRSAQLSLQVKRRIAELTTLNAIGMAISSASELGEILNRITLTSSKILQADGSILRLFDEESGVLKAVSSYGLTEEAGSLRPIPLGEEVAGTVALTGEAILLQDARASSFAFRGLPRGIFSIVCVPLIFKSRTIGTLAVFSLSQEGRPEKIFNEEDKNLLSTMASQIAMTIENAIILQRAELLARDKERVVQELSLLYDVSRWMLTTTKFENILHIILMAITVCNRKGFDRGAVFLVDEKENILQGKLGVGPKNLEELERWRQKFEEHRLSAAEWVTGKELDQNLFNLQVQKARISLEEKPSILIKTLREKRAFNIENASTDSEVNPAILKWFGSRAFASVPLIAKGKAIGLIVADNLLTGRPVTSADIGFLTLLSNQAGLALENSRLYGNLQEMNIQLLQTQNRLIQSEKLAAMGELVASITHEIKNPLVSIGGFARRIDRHLAEESPEKKYIHIVLDEVKRLERFLDETLDFSKKTSAPFEPRNLNDIIQDTLSFLSGEFLDKGISVASKLAPELPAFLCDPQQMKQVFLNLFVNAMQAMGRKGQLTVKTTLRNEGKKKAIQIEVGDTGGGIPLEVLENIFNPFFTTKPDGTGLGLPIAHKIISLHGGEIEVANYPGVGATFFTRFPLPNPSADS